MKDLQEKLRQATERTPEEAERRKKARREIAILQRRIERLKIDYQRALYTASEDVQFAILAQIQRLQGRISSYDENK